MLKSRNVKSIDPVDLKKGDLIKIYSSCVGIKREQHFVVVEPNFREVKQVYHFLDGQAIAHEAELLVLRNDGNHMKNSPYIIKIGDGVEKYLNNGSIWGAGRDTVVRITIEPADC